MPSVLCSAAEAQELRETGARPTRPRPPPGGATAAPMEAPPLPASQTAVTSGQPASQVQGGPSTVSCSHTAAEAAAEPPLGGDVNRGGRLPSAADKLASSEQGEIMGEVAQESADEGSAATAKVAKQGSHAAEAAAAVPGRAAAALQEHGAKVAAAVQAQGSRAASAAKEVGQAAAEKASTSAQVGCVEGRSMDVCALSPCSVPCNPTSCHPVCRLLGRLPARLLTRRKPPPQAQVHAQGGLHM